MEYGEERLSAELVLARTRAPDLESVKKLNFWGSDITDISVVRQMPNLEICSVSVNSITTLKDFSYCLSLQELYIRKNKIEDLSEINYLKELPKLRNLWLADNPCASGENYRPTVLTTLPNLQKLDNKVVTEKELEALGIHDLSSERSEYGESTEGQDDKVTGGEDDEVTGGEDDKVTGGQDDKATGGQDDEVTGGQDDEVTGGQDDEVTGGQDDTVLESNKTEINEDHDADPEVTGKVDPVINGSEGRESPVTGQEGNGSKPTVKHANSLLDPVTLSWEETNKIRQDLGLKPLPFEKMTSPKSVPKTADKSRNAHLLQAVLILIRELDNDSLEIVESAVKRKLHPET